MIWLEPCAGSFAAGFHLFGLRAPVGWQGGKTRYAAGIVEGLGLSGVRPVAVGLSDLLWADCLTVLCRPGGAERVRGILARWLATTPDTPHGHRALWLRLPHLRGSRSSGAARRFWPGMEEMTRAVFRWCGTQSERGWGLGVPDYLEHVAGLTGWRFFGVLGGPDEPHEALRHVLHRVTGRSA